MLLFLFVRVKRIHNEIVDGLQFFLVLNGAQDRLTVLFHRFENADLQL